MNVKLTPQSEDILREYLARGSYHSPEEVIEHALQILAAKEGVASPNLSPRHQCAGDFEAFLDALAVYSDKIPPMPGETFSREMIYQDHD